MRSLGFIVTCLLLATSANAQQKPLLAEDVFKNVQVLKGIPVKEFMNTMGFFSAATNLNCIDCHSPQSESLEGYAIDTPRKQVGGAVFRESCEIVGGVAYGRAQFNSLKSGCGELLDGGGKILGDHLADN